MTNRGQIQKNQKILLFFYFFDKHRETLVDLFIFRLNILFGSYRCIICKKLDYLVLFGEMNIFAFIMYNFLIFLFEL